MSHRLLALSSLLVLAGCPQPTQPTLPPPPAVARFTASPARAAPGDTVTLSWEVTAATKVSIAEVGGAALAGVDDRLDGTLEVTLGADDAIYVLTAENERGVRATALASVKVEGNLALLFAAVPPELPAVGTSSLVWSVPGARSVSITSGGVALDLQGQGASGSVVVDPAAATTEYTLTADGQSRTIEVTRAQDITSFTVTPANARHGENITLSWTTRAATRVTITSPGLPVIAEVTDPAQVASGSTTWTLPSTDVAQNLPLVLRAEGRGPAVERAITLFPNDAVPQMLTVTADRYVRQGAPFVLSWTTRGADMVRVTVAGTPVYEGVANGSVTLPSPANETTYDVVAVRVRTEQVSAPLSVTVASVGVPTLVDFSASTPSIAAGGTPVTLSWNVTNARNLTIREVGGPLVHQVTGVGATTGSVVVYPNQPTTRYELEADNLAQQFVSPTQVSVEVQAPARLTFSTLRPAGSTVEVTGSTADAGTVTGLPLARTSTTDTFVDISGDGTPITFSSADTGNASIDLGSFTTQLFGVPTTKLRLSVSTNGWMVFNPTGVSGPTTPAAIGTALQPFALAVFYTDLDTASGRAYWRIDTVNGDRRLIVQWTGVTDGSTTPTADLTFQAQVYESGRVVYAYDTIDDFTGTAQAGIVNADETLVLMAPATPSAGAVFTFFADVALPAPVRVNDGPLWASVRMPMGLMRISGDPRLLPGQLALTEANPRPGVDGGEWVEVTNSSPVPLDLGGYSLSVDAGARVSLTAPLVVPPGGRVLLGAEAQANDGLTLAATYGTPLATRGGALTLSTEGVTVSRMELAQDGGVGRSVRADPQTAGMRFNNSNNVQLTCPDGTNTYGTNGQFGTPGQAQGRCFPYVLVRDAGVPFTSIASTGTQLVGGSSGGADESVFQISPVKPVLLFGVPRTSLWVSTNGFLATSNVAPTLSNKTTPSGTAPTAGTIAPFWDTLTGQGVPGSGIFWQEFDPNGTPNDGDEVLVVSWERWRYDSTTVTDLNFQVRFWANGDISYHFGTMTAAGTSAVASGSSSTIWLEDPQGRSALAVGVNTSGTITSGATFRYVFSP